MTDQPQYQPGDIANGHVWTGAEWVPSPEPLAPAVVPKSRTGLIVGLAVGGVVLLGIIAAGVWILVGNRNSASSHLADAMTACKAPGMTAFEFRDDGNTLILDGEGDEDPNGAPIERIACVLAALDTPASVTQRMDQTRALDGMQDATVDGLHYSWTYHPDNGLDIIIETAR